MFICLCLEGKKLYIVKVLYFLFVDIFFYECVIKGFILKKYPSTKGL